MTPARTNQNWLPGIFNEILGDNCSAVLRDLHFRRRFFIFAV